MISGTAWRTFAATVLLMAGCGTADVTSQGTSASGTGDPGFVSQGISLTQTVPSAEVSAASPSAAAARVGDAPIAAAGAPSTVPRAIPRLRGPRPALLPPLFEPISPSGVDAPGIQRSSAGSAPLASGPVPLAPALLATFAGLPDDGTVIPPDTMGAAGPNHLVSFLNSEVGFFSKTTGARLNPGVSLLDFWSPVISPNHLPTGVFDPKVIYDASSGRFIAVTLDGRLPNDAFSFVLLAVSRTSDPTAGWSAWALPADNTGATWADFPGLGVDDNNVYITTNLFDAADHFFQSKVWRVPKPQLLILPQSATLTRTEFTHPAFGLQPAHAFGPGPAGYILAEADFTRFLEVFRITGTPPTLSSLGTVGVSPYPFIPISLPPAPQPSIVTASIDTGDTRILNVVYRNGHLFATHTVSNSANTKTEVAWYEIVPSSPPTLAQQGRVSHTSRFYYCPSIAANVNGDVALGFSGSSPTEFAGGYYTARFSSDPPGTTQPVGLLKAGEDPYVVTGSGTVNRWGDFSATVVDPIDDLIFWTLQEYAGTHTPQTGDQWGTWWGSFRVTDIVAPDNVVATLLDNLVVRLTWNDRAANDIAYVVERKTGAGGTFAVLTSLPANSTSYIDNSGLAIGTTYFYRVGAVSSNSTGYSSEVQVVTPAPPSSGSGGCLSIARTEGEPPFAAAAASVGILLLPAAALVLRRFSLRIARKRVFRHPAC